MDKEENSVGTASHSADYIQLYDAMQYILLKYVQDFHLINSFEISIKVLLFVTPGPSFSSTMAFNGAFIHLDV